jgi:hypothetical protein
MITGPERPCSCGAPTLAGGFANAYAVFAHIEYAVRYWPTGQEGPFNPRVFEDAFRHAMRDVARSGRALELTIGGPPRPWIPQWWSEEGGCDHLRELCPHHRRLSQRGLALPPNAEARPRSRPNRGLASAPETCRAEPENAARNSVIPPLIDTTNAPMAARLSINAFSSGPLVGDKPASRKAGNP